MLIESDCPQDQRYIFTDILLPQESLEAWKKPVFSNYERRKEMGMKVNQVLTERFLNWKLTDKQFALFTMYSYADLKVPKSFSCVFDVRNPLNFEKCNLTLKLSVYEGIFCTNSIDHGHKHLQIFEAQTFPKLIARMKPTYGEYKYDPLALKIGLCKFEDYESISKSLSESSKP